MIMVIREATYRRIESENMLAVQKRVDGAIMEALAYNPRRSIVSRHHPVEEHSGIEPKCPALDGMDCSYKYASEEYAKEVLSEPSDEGKYEALERILRRGA